MKITTDTTTRLFDLQMMKPKDKQWEKYVILFQAGKKKT